MRQARRDFAMSRFLIVFGIVCVIAGLVGPALTRWGFGRLPGDFRIVRDGFVLYIPLASGLLVSTAVSVVLWLLRR